MYENHMIFVHCYNYYMVLIVLGDRGDWLKSFVRHKGLQPDPLGPPSQTLSVPQTNRNHTKSIKMYWKFMVSVHLN